MGNNVINASEVYLSYLQDQNEEDIQGRPVQIARQHCLEAAAVACLPATALSHWSPLLLFCHRSILPWYGHHPYIVCKEYQGNRGLSHLTFLTQIRIFSFGTINE